MRDGLGVDAGVAQGDVAAERMADDSHRREVPLVDQLREVIDVVRGSVMPGIGPLRVAVTAEVRGDDVIFVPQRGRDPVPVAAMVPPAMDEQQRWGVRVAPVDVVQPQTLRKIHPGCRPDHGYPFPIGTKIGAPGFIPEVRTSDSRSNTVMAGTSPQLSGSESARQAV